MPSEDIELDIHLGSREIVKVEIEVDRNVLALQRDGQQQRDDQWVWGSLGDEERQGLVV